MKRNRNIIHLEWSTNGFAKIHYGKSHAADELLHGIKYRISIDMNKAFMEGLNQKKYDLVSYREV